MARRETTMKAEALAAGSGGMWPWLAQRVTAAAVIVTIMVHLVLTHFFAIGELSFDDIGDRLGNVAVLINDVLLLLAVVFHGLNGLRMVVLDYGLQGAAARRAFDVALWLVGIAGTLYGLWALTVWVL